ncbi:MAG: sugar nucleotide-binding protein [Lachnospiraceae bacterium]
MRIAIIGSAGYIAGYLYERLSKSKEIETLWRIGRGEKADFLLDLYYPEKFDYSVLKSIDYIIFTAAVSGPDRCADEYDACWRINVDGTRYFIQNAVNMGCRVIFFSSDAVYGDIPGYVYSEEMETRAKTPYGRMKKAIEDDFKMNPLFKAIRLSYVVSVKDRFVSYCLECLKSRGEAEIFHPFYRNCITISDVGKIVEWLFQNWTVFPYTFLNAAGTELVSRVRIADEINRITNRRLKFKIISPDERFFLNRPQFTQMESKYLYTYHIINRQTFSQKFQNELEGFICRQEVRM